MINNNPTLEYDELQLEIAITDHLAGKNLRLPDLNGVISNSVSDGRSLDQITYEYYKQSLFNNIYRVQSDVTLFQGGRINAAINKYKIDVESQKLKIRNTSIKLQQELLTQYIEACMLHELIQVWQNNINYLNQLKELSLLLIKSGKITSTSSANIEIDINKYTQYLDNIKYRHEASVLKIKRLIGYPFEKPLVLHYIEIKKSPALYSYSDDEIKQIALSSPAYKAASSKSYSYKQDLRIMQSARYPRLTVGGVIGTGYSSVLNSSALLNSNWQEQISNNRYQMLTLNLYIPIFNKFQYSNYYKKSKISYLQSIELQKQTEAEVTEWLYVQNNNIKNYYSNYTSGLKSIELFNTILTESMNNYKAGKMSTFDFLLVQQQKALLEENMIIQKYNFLVSQKSIELYKNGEIDFDIL